MKGADRADGTDPLAGFVGFTAALRAAGLPCDSRRVQAYLAAVELLDVADWAALYWAGRLTLCADPDDLGRYDDAFLAWFGASAPSGTPAPGRQQVWSARLPTGAEQPAGTDATDDAAEPLALAASATEVLRHRDLAALDAAQREHLRELFTRLRPALPRRASQRQRPTRRGALDPRRTLRGMLAGGGEPVRLAHRRRADRPRRVVLLIDVSGSMSAYADALLRFAHVLVRGAPAGVEVFTMGTRLTRVSRQLRQRDPERALLAAGGAVPDFAGGTRLGETMRAFLDRWGQRGMARQAVVVVFSDGWERGDPALLGEQAARMRRLAHRVLWVNPHAGRDGYLPIQSGIAAVVPHVDEVLAGHSLHTLERLLAIIRAG